MAHNRTIVIGSLLAVVLVIGAYTYMAKQTAVPAPVTSAANSEAERSPLPPIVVTTARVLSDSDLDKMKEPDTIDDNPISRWSIAKLGIATSNMWVLADEAALEKKVRLALTGEEELPDVLLLNNRILSRLLDELVASGRFADIGDSFERYASPRLKEAYALNPDVWKTVRVGGKLWGLPQISDGKVGDPILWVRQDWLDRLGLAVPTTLNELTAVLDAFTNRDPDGNGKDDTIGLALAGKNSLNGWIGDASFVFGAFGDQPYQWNRMPDGSLAYGSVQPGMRDALAVLAEWYGRGYLHPNFGTYDEQSASSLFADGQAGIISGPGWMGGWPLSEVPQGPDMPVFKPIPFPSGPDGNIGRRGSNISYGSYVFRQGFEHMDAVFRYYDEVFGALIEDPASDFLHGFAENYDYKRVGDEVLYDFPGKTSTISRQLLVALGSTPPGVIRGESIEQRVYRGKIDTPYEKRLAATSSKLFLEGSIVSDQQLDYARKDEFVGAPGPKMRAKWPALQDMEKKAFLKIVYGNEQPDSFVQFVRDWHVYGGEEITREVNEWDRANR
ncbi:MAG: hypothetical protein K0Q94_4028 [Paenibacillus sp.]|jgi:putative aldouronate transport system substrate-binding protein|nr:hypothetical protein [Paenibacillus sp.]